MVEDGRSVVKWKQHMWICDGHAAPTVPFTLRTLAVFGEVEVQRRLKEAAAVTG